MSVKVFGIKALQTNYVWVLRDELKNQTLVVDPSEFKPVDDFLKSKGWNLDAILITHHHPDHVGGNIWLHDVYHCPVYGWHGDAHRIPALTHPLQEGESFDWHGLKAEVLFIPGHTLGHVSYYFKSEQIVFVGDTLFGMGCGRLFEGSAQQLLTSLKRLRSLPSDTKVYCGHEYTLDNAKFARDLMSHKPEFTSRYRKVKTNREKDLPTVPFLLSEELQTNPFLNTGDEHLKVTLGLSGSSELDVFTHLRRLKDNFRSA